jgi:preprotein translocase subunit YajC
VITASIALGATSGGSAGGGMSIVFIQMIVIVAIFYFLIIRPKMQQEKKHRARLETIKVKDQIITAGGIIGEVVHVKDDQLTVKSGESRLIIQRDRVAVVRSPGERAEDEKK